MLSVASIVTLVVGLLIFFGFLLMKKFKRVIGVNSLRILIVACIVLGTTSVFVGGLAVGGSVTATIGREETLTGRSKIWAKFVPEALKEPFIGHGIGGFWTDEIVEQYHLQRMAIFFLSFLRLQRIAS